MNITREFLLKVAPAANAAIIDELVKHQSVLYEHGIQSVADVCHSIGQMAAETQGFTRLEESLYYTTISRIRAVWPSRFKSDDAARPFVRNPQKLANKVYGGRYGNNTVNDGWLFRGSGCKQTTFKANYQEVENESGIRCVQSPELLRTFPAALTSAAIYWEKRDLGRFAANGDVTGLTKAIQGGAGALADRKTFTARALSHADMLDGATQTATVKKPPAKPAATKPAASAVKVFWRNGDTGKFVEDIQRKLHLLGYTSVGDIDAKFGDATEDAVKLLQARYGLVADGVVGPATIKALNDAKRSDYRDPPAPLPKASGLNSFLQWLVGVLASIFNRQGG